MNLYVGSDGLSWHADVASSEKAGMSFTFAAFISCQQNFSTERLSLVLVQLIDLPGSPRV